MAELDIAFERTSASRYAGSLREAMHQDEPRKLLDLLLVGAIIEARSCERFARLAPRLPERVGRFYAGLLAAEARHFEHYVAFARSECGFDDTHVDARLGQLQQLEGELITRDDTQLRFHSGVPAGS
jgi:tRNA-(ms[2]io[6]A)-hydroxylase